MSDNGGPASPRPCRTCHSEFVPKQYQIIKGDYQCPACKRNRQNAANEGKDFSPIAKVRYALRKDAISAYFKKKKEDPAYVEKRRARRLLAYAVEKGEVVKAPCVDCGSIRSEAHHDDYAKPLEVTWLCRKCHARRERYANQAAV